MLDAGAGSHQVEDALDPEHGAEWLGHGVPGVHPRHGGEGAAAGGGGLAGRGHADPVRRQGNLW